MQTCTLGSLAMCRTLRRAPIPGRRSRLDENIGALDVPLRRDELASIERIFPAQTVAGARHAPAGMAHIGR